jgi:hypothetical protein
MTSLLILLSLGIIAISTVSIFIKLCDVPALIIGGGKVLKK